MRHDEAMTLLLLIAAAAIALTLWIVSRRRTTRLVAVPRPSQIPSLRDTLERKVRDGEL